MQLSVSSDQFWQVFLV